MALVTDFSRLRLKRMTTSGEVPTVPSTSEPDENWLPTDLLIGEACVNTADDKFWVRTDNGIIELAESEAVYPQVTTSDATLTTVLTIPIATSTCRFLEIIVTAMQDDDSKGFYRTMKIGYRNDAGTVSAVGVAINVQQSDFTTATASVSISGTDVLVQVTGEAATNIVWSAKYTEGFVDTTL